MSKWNKTKTGTDLFCKSTWSTPRCWTFSSVLSYWNPVASPQPHAFGDKQKTHRTCRHIVHLINAWSVVPTIAVASLFSCPATIKKCTNQSRYHLVGGGSRAFQRVADDAVSMSQYRKSVQVSRPQSVSAADTAALL